MSLLQGEMFVTQPPPNKIITHEFILLEYQCLIFDIEELWSFQRLELFIQRQSVTSKKTWIFSIAAGRTSNLVRIFQLHSRHCLKTVSLLTLTFVLGACESNSLQTFVFIVLWYWIHWRILPNYFRIDLNVCHTEAMAHAIATHLTTSSLFADMQN